MAETDINQGSSTAKKPVKKTARPPVPKRQAKGVSSTESNQYGVTRDVWEDIKRRNVGRSGADAKIFMREELEPHMGDYGQYGPFSGTYGSGLFPGLVSSPAVQPRTFMPREPWDGGGYGGGGGGGGGLLPPVIPEMKIRSTLGPRRSPYWESTDPYQRDFEPRFVVLGNTSSWA